MVKSERPRTGERRLAEITDQAEHARRRYDLYKARSYSSRPSSPARLRELQRESERAQARLERSRGENA